MPTTANTEILAAAIEGFEVQKKRIDAQIAELRQMLHPTASGTTDGAPRKRRRMSRAARARIAAAQRKRWAESKQQSGIASPAAPARKKRRRLSAAGRKAIIEATKRRWAALRKAQAK